MSPLPIEEYQVGWVCALPQELTAARVMRDEEHGQYKGQVPHENNCYVLRRIQGHNVVITYMPTYGRIWQVCRNPVHSHGGHWWWDPRLKQGRGNQTRRCGDQSA
jgi:hypothetical protein